MEGPGVNVKPQGRGVGGPGMHAVGARGNAAGEGGDAVGRGSELGGRGRVGHGHSLRRTKHPV